MAVFTATIILTMWWWRWWQWKGVRLGERIHNESTRACGFLVIVIMIVIISIIIIIIIIIIMMIDMIFT